ERCRWSAPHDTIGVAGASHVLVEFALAHARLAQHVPQQRAGEGLFRAVHGDLGEWLFPHPLLVRRSLALARLEPQRTQGALDLFAVERRVMRSHAAASRITSVKGLRLRDPCRA